MGYVNKTYLSTQFKNFADKIAKVFSKIGHTHLKSDITDFPTSMPANGGNAATVGGHTVGVNVPSNAKFTDTTYGVATSSALGLVKSGADITVDSSGNVSVNDDSHNHVISNVDGLQSALDGKLSKTTYEYNKELALGSSGKVCIGIFPCYDSNISVEIKSTTNTTYNGTLIIATQNINTSLGGTYSATVYGDEKNTLTSAIKIQYLSGSNAFSVYINLPSWSKNLLHIQCVSLAGTPSSIATIVDSIPSTATIVPTNAFTHTHNYAGSSSAGGSATSAVKLDSSAGSATQPVYFNSGKPVACTYTLSKSVPSNAVFTDTWRGIQNNLTSNSTTDSLSAAQGKVLKGLVDGKAASSHTHTKSQITDFPTSLPASDVYAWAKASTKPTYTAREIGALPISGGTITGEILSRKTSTSLKLTENAELICSTEGLGDLTIKESEINFSSNSGSGTLNKTNLEFSGGGTTTTYSNDSVTKKLGNNIYTLSLPSKTGTLALTSDIVNTSTIVDLIYPVGSIYMSVNNVNPSTFLGGTWEAWGSGQVPVGVNPNDSDFSTAEKTGGSKSVTPSGTVGGHTLTTNEMPSHGHSISIPASGACTTDSQGNHQHKTNATFVDNAVRLSSEHNTVMGWVSGWGYKSNANRGLNAKTDVSLSIYVPQLSMSINGLHAHNVPNHAHNVTQYNAGGNGSHDHSFTGNVQSNIQPYITCYMWKRTA